MRSIDEQEPVKNRSRENRTNALVSGVIRDTSESATG